jgi:hypothetical protein
MRASILISKLIGLAAAVVFLLGAGPAFAATHYATPAGSASNWPCTTSAKPCSLAAAIEGSGSQKPAAGDQVIIEPGHYTPTEGTQIVAPVTEDIHGAAGEAAPEIAGTFAASSNVLGSAYNFLTLHGGELTDVEIGSTGSTNDDTTTVESNGGTVLDDDLVTAYEPDQYGEAFAISLSTGDKLLDSVAVANASTGSTGRAVEANGDSGASADPTITLRNVTAYASGADGIAVTASQEIDGPCAWHTEVSLRNVIAEVSGPQGIGLNSIEACQGGSIDLNVDYSDFDPSLDNTFQDATITLGSHDISRPALFVNAGELNYQEEPDSPTVDRGTDNPQDGAFDPAGRPRFLGAAPDIGAYELPAPDAVTGNVSSLSQTGATLNGTVDSEGSDLPTTYTLQYGTNEFYASTPEVASGTEPAAEHPIPFPQSVSEAITGLQPDTTYDYRLVANNADGQTFGANHQFTTASVSHQVQLHLVVAGTGTGVVNSAPDVGGTDQTSTLTLTEGTAYTLTATPDPGSTFVGWSGACSGTGTCKLNLDQAATLTATFDKTAGHGKPSGRTHGKPTLTDFTLSGLANDKPKLLFAVNAGVGAPKLRRVQITLPNDLKFVTIKRGIELSIRHAKLKLRHGILTITFAAAASDVHIEIGGHALTTVTPKHPHHTLTVKATDAAGKTTRLEQRT